MPNRPQRTALAGLMLISGLAMAGCPDKSSPPAVTPTPAPSSPNSAAAPVPSASKDSAPAPAAIKPWAEPIVIDDFAVALDGLRVFSRFALTAGNTSTHAGMRIGLRAQRKLRNEQPYAIRTIRLTELRDERGRDLTPFRVFGRGPSNFRPARADSATTADLWFDGMADLPEGVSVVRGEIDITAMDGVTTVDVPIKRLATWTPVPGIDGLFMIIDGESEDGATRGGANLLLKRVVPPDVRRASTPYLLNVAMLPPEGETKTVSRDMAETLVDGGEISRYNVSSFGLDLDACKLRITAATTERVVTLPFEFRNIPGAGDAPTGMIAASSEPIPMLDSGEELTAALPPLEKNALLMRQLWVEAEGEVNASPGQVRIERNAKITASLEDLMRTRIYAAAPKLVIERITDESGKDLLAQTVQFTDIYSGPRGWYRPRVGSNPQGGQMTFELKGPMRLPRKLGVVKGYAEVLFAGGEKAVEIAPEPSETFAPLAVAPQIKARVVRKDGQLLIEYTRPFTEKLPEGPGGWKPRRDAGDAGPPFVLALEFMRDGKMMRRREPTEHVEADGVRGVFSFQPKDLEKTETLRLIVLTEVKPVRIEFEHKDVPIASWR